ncbi:MAG: molecular chaperone TorD family protein [Firmicutes bacterium]|nr:molecular chaperone TorD family protein [Bacillota bacterium]
MLNSDADERRELCLSRAGVYKLLGAMFLYEPRLPFLRQLKQPEVASIFESLGVPLLEPGSDAGQTTEGLVEELAVEFARLFLGPGRHFPPYESVWVGNVNSSPEGGGLLFGPQAVAVRREIDGLGLAVLADRGVLPDHIGIELQLVAFMAEQEAVSWETGDRDAADRWRARQISFLDDHILRWVPAYCSTVEKEAEKRFYTRLARLTSMFVTSDRQAFSGPHA